MPILKQRIMPKALPYLEDYVSRSKKVRREDLYELSYCYYPGQTIRQGHRWFQTIEWESRFT